MTHDRYLADQWTLLIQVLEELQAGRIGVTQGCRTVVALRTVLGEEKNELFTPFVAVDSETDHFQLGEVRNSWSAVALDREDKERSAREQFHADHIANAARKLLSHARAHAL
jgi:hypothetical protein